MDPFVQRSVCPRAWSTPRLRCSSSGCCCCSPRWPGKLARRAGLPAVLGYLLVGVAVSPFTPGYVANRDQLRGPRRRRRRAPACSRSASRSTRSGSRANAGGCSCCAPAPGARHVGERRRRLPGCRHWTRQAPGLVGLSIAMSSSVVVVNITRSRRRTTRSRN